MSQLLEVFTTNLLPIFIIAGIGYLLNRFLEIDPRTLSRVIFYVFTPCLVYSLIAQNGIEADESLRLAALAVLNTTAIGLLAWLIGRLLKFERRVLVAVIMTTIFVNAGNYGLSVNAFAFGETGKAYASVYFVTMASLTYLVGVMLASMGKASLKEAFISLFKYPVLYALLLAFLSMNFDWRLPIPISRSIEVLSQAAIPSMLLLLGMQLRRVDWKAQPLAFGLANLLRLVAAPLVALGMAALLGLTLDARRAGVLEASMPSAVMCIVLATEFEVEPALVTTIVTATTLLSPLTLTPLLVFLGA